MLKKFQTQTKKHLKLDVVMLIILINIIVYLIEQNYCLDQYEFIIGRSKIINICLSFFRHKDSYHLIGNIITFYMTSRSIYDKQTGYIKSCRTFIYIYLAAGFVGSYFEIFIYNFLNDQWQNEVQNVSESYRCKYFFCKWVDLKTDTIASYVYSLWNFNKVFALITLEKMRIRGPESCIYGIIGIEVGRRLFGQENVFKNTYDKVKIHLGECDLLRGVSEIASFLYDLFELLTLIFDILSKFYNVPWEINYLLNSFVSYKIIHNCHIGGALVGLIISILFRRCKL